MTPPTTPEKGKPTEQEERDHHFRHLLERFRQARTAQAVGIWNGAEGDRDKMLMRRDVVAELVTTGVSQTAAIERARLDPRVLEADRHADKHRNRAALAELDAEALGYEIRWALLEMEFHALKTMGA